MERNVMWFEHEIAPLLKGYRIEYKKFKGGDLGDLERAEFNVDERGGGIEFWSSGYIGIHFMDYQNNEVLLNILFDPGNEDEMEVSLRTLVESIQNG